MHFFEQVAAVTTTLLHSHHGLFSPLVRPVLPAFKYLVVALIAELGLVGRELRLTYHGVDAFQTAGELHACVFVLLDLGCLLASVGLAGAF